MALISAAVDGYATKTQQFNRIIDALPPIGGVVQFALGLLASTTTAVVSGTANSDVTSHLVASAANFSAVTVGDIAYNATSPAFAAVLNKNSNTDLTLDSDIFPAGTGSFSVFHRPLVPHVAAGSGDSVRWWPCDGSTIISPESAFNNKAAPTVAPVPGYPYWVSLLRVK